VKAYFLLSSRFLSRWWLFHFPLRSVVVLVDWLQGTSLEADSKDKQALATANSFIFSHVARGVVKLEEDRLQSFVREDAANTVGVNLLFTISRKVLWSATPVQCNPVELILLYCMCL